MVFMRLPNLAGAVLALALGASPLVPLWAQSTTTTPPAEQRNFSDDHLKQYAMAAVEVRRIKDEYQPQMESAGTPEQRQQMENAAVEEMVSAVNEAGLTVDTFNQISLAAQADPALAQRIDRFLEDAQ